MGSVTVDAASLLHRTGFSKGGTINDFRRRSTVFVVGYGVRKTGDPGKPALIAAAKRLLERAEVAS